MRRALISDEELTARMTARGVPAVGASIALGLYRASRDGELATVDPTLAQLVGRAPTRMRDLLATRIER